jgi:hypothetical protein
MKNGHAKTRPANAALKAAGYWIRSAPSKHGDRTLYWWSRGDECGDDEWARASAEAAAREHLAGAPAPFVA